MTGSVLAYGSTVRPARRTAPGVRTTGQANQEVAGHVGAGQERQIVAL